MTFCHGLKLEAPDGKQRVTDCANTEGLFRIIQTIPSPKAEPFKRWLAQVGYERVKEIENPELASARARDLYQAKGYPQAWIEKRLRSISTAADNLHLIDESSHRPVFVRYGEPSVPLGQSKGRRCATSLRQAQPERIFGLDGLSEQY